MDLQSNKMLYQKYEHFVRYQKKKSKIKTMDLQSNKCYTKSMNILFNTKKKKENKANGFTKQ